MPDGLEDLGRIGTIGRNIIQYAERLKVVGLIAEKSVSANIAMSKHTQLKVAWCLKLHAAKLRVLI